MLTIHYGDMDNVIYNTSVYFDNVYSPSGLKIPLPNVSLNLSTRALSSGPCHRH